ncbi:MAG TPA: DUF1858 domain-containing protein [Parvibaculum sp.]|uniref:DUF1858 domain-containing protein n=1 Tax=Parvibaculum sp. TaxID=2024848 RepID=UPI002CFC0CE3|nr:DUF1858 domain-containing protein [Parvibaculum sp.]HMM14366.1 DUF1858 domain-containing protein [Parvibaculum sp.]
MTIDEEMTVADLMDRWPGTIGVFIRHRMSCVGCPVSPFHSIRVACAEHGVPLAPFLAALAEEIGDEG